MGVLHHLDDKYTAVSGDVFITGTQALVRLPMAQMRRDHALGLNTAAYISGYRGSPIGAYDQQLLAAKKHLDKYGVVFQPGVNEDLAATAVWGTQQLDFSRSPKYEGVVGYWYGKGPGVDRCGDVFKHANAAGTSPHGGVLCFAGDDHSAKSSTLPHQSDHEFIAAVMPVLYPSSIHEFIELGLLGIAMSRYSGCWIGYKVISDTIETSAVVSVSDEHRAYVIPQDFQRPDSGLNIRWPDPPLVQDDRLQEYKAYAALAFARANQVDRVILEAPDAHFGIVATGKAFEDVKQALAELGIDDNTAKSIGLRLYKVRMPWPLEPEGIRKFSEGLDEVLIIEERREIIENQIKQQLFNWRADVRPRIVGKFDENDQPFLPLSAALSTSRVARAIATRLLKFDFDASLKQRIEQRLAYLQRRADEKARHKAPIERQPWFCSGCPHNSSTKVPDGSVAMAGIGCHYMVQWMDRNTDTFTQMGGEGVPWTSLSHFTDEAHRFVNLGDGTYFHSGLLAIRAAVASGVNITYKVLYNDAVAMTGGQSVDGELSPGRIVNQLHAEGVSPVYLVSDEPDLYKDESYPSKTIIAHRDELDSIMRKLREKTGCNAIVFAQTCAAEKRRRRKRGLLEDPAKRAWIHTDVCEGCGDCSEQSNCVSIEPVETPFGRKRRINQSSCNKDFSCVKGFCPSFVTIEGGSLKKKQIAHVSDKNDSDLPEPEILPLSASSWNIAITGVGGTGVLTIGALIGKAAHIEGAASMVLDMAGLAQKGGAVLSHVRLASTPESVSSPHIVPGSADVLLAADAVVAASSEGVVLCDPKRTHAVLNTRSAPVASFVKHRDVNFRADDIESEVTKFTRGRDHFLPFADLAERWLGDSIATNIMMMGYAWQCGLLPLSFASLDAAIVLNGVAVDANRAAFKHGRRLALNPELARQPKTEAASDSATQSEPTLQTFMGSRFDHLRAYQSHRYAKRFQKRVLAFTKYCEQLGLDDELPRIVVNNYAKLLAYKDEYEVARLYSLPAFRSQLENTFDGDYSIYLHLAPPGLTRTGSDGRPVKKRFGQWILGIFRVLKHGKRLRGTPFDVFGHTAERRRERQWISWYEDDIELVMQHLNAGNVDLARRVLSIPQQIRGFGPVKHAAMDEASTQRKSARDDLSKPAVVPQINKVAA